MGEIVSHGATRDCVKVYDQLKSATMNYRFRPGEQIMVNDLADRLKVSSTPVREALIRLQGEFLLDPSPRRGFFAKTLDGAEMAELFQVRFSILQPLIAKLAETPKEALLAELSQRQSAFGAGPACATAPDAESLSPEAVAHRASLVCETLARCSGGKTIAGIVRSANERTHYIRTLYLEMPGQSAEMRTTLESVAVGLARNDCAGAVELLRRNLLRILELLPSLVKEGISRAYLRPSWTKAPNLAFARQTPSSLTTGHGYATRR